MSAATFVMDNQQSPYSEETLHAYSYELTQLQACYLFMSHTLSIWNSRMFELVWQESIASSEPDSQILCDDGNHALEFIHSGVVSG